MINDNDLNTRIMTERQMQFVERWAPAEPHRRREFERDLLYLVHTIYHEATKPILDKWAESISRMPFSFTLPQPAKDKP